MDRFSFKLLILGLVLLSLSEVIWGNEEQTAIEGSSYKMKCSDTIDQDPSTSTRTLGTNTIVIWSVNGRIPTGSKYKMLTDGLVIRNVSREDAFSNYTCTILDRFTFTPVHSANIRLKLRQRSGKFLESSSTREQPATNNTVQVWGIVNQWVKLQCNMFSRPRPSFEWINDAIGEKLQNSSFLKITEDEFTSNLTIFLHNQTFFGEYICKASNNHGESVQRFALSEGYVPKSPFIYPTYIGSDRLIIKVEPQEVFRKDLPSYKILLPITEYIIEYIEAKNLTSSGNLSSGRFRSTIKEWKTVTTQAGNKNPHITTPRDREAIEIKNLKESTTYLIRAAVANVVAKSNFSSAMRITTATDSSGAENSVNITPTTTQNTIQGAKTRDEYGRASNYFPENKSVPINVTMRENSAIQDDCQRYRKTVLRTIITTTMIEDLMAANGNNENETVSLVKKRVEEDTSAEKIFLCTIPE